MDPIGKSGIANDALRITPGTVSNNRKASKPEPRIELPDEIRQNPMNFGSRQWSTTDEKELTINVVTAQGDKVTLSSSLVTREKSYIRQVGTYIPGLEDSRERMENIEVSVEGDLDERELEEIEAFKAAAKDALAAFSEEGRDVSSLISEMDVSQWESLSAVQADYSETSSMAWGDELVYGVPTEMPPGPAVSASRESLTVEKGDDLSFLKLQTIGFERNAASGVTIDANRQSAPGITLRAYSPEANNAEEAGTGENWIRPTLIRHDKSAGQPGEYASAPGKGKSGNPDLNSVKAGTAAGDHSNGGVAGIAGNHGLYGSLVHGRNQGREADSVTLSTSADVVRSGLKPSAAERAPVPDESSLEKADAEKMPRRPQAYIPDFQQDNTLKIIEDVKEQQESEKKVPGMDRNMGRGVHTSV